MQFLLCFVFCLSALFLPGYLLLRSLSLFSRWESLACAPAVSLAIFGLLSIIYSAFGISCSGIRLVIGASILLSTVIIGRRVLVGRTKLTLHVWEGVQEELSWWGRWGDIATLVLSLIVSAVLLSVFINKLGGIDTVIHGYDTVFHINLVRSFVDSGDYSSLNATLYPVNAASSTIPIAPNEPTFYPALWHVMSAMTFSILGGQLSVAVNAVTIALVGVVYPLGVWGLLRTLFHEEWAVRVAGALFAMASAAYPWDLLLRGEQYPQIAAFALVPVSVILFVKTCDTKLLLQVRLGRVACFLASLVALILLQTNSVFTVGLFVAPYVAHKLYQLPFSVSRRRCLVALWLSFVVAVWALCYSAPFLQGIVSYSWPAFTDFGEALLRLTQFRLSEDGTSQIVLAVFLALGLFRLSVIDRNRGRTWLAALYVLPAAIYVADVSSDGVIKHVLSGFWYTDPDRTSAMLSIYSVLVVSCGVSYAVELTRQLVTRLPVSFGSTVWRFCCSLVFALSAFFIYGPWNIFQRIGESYTAFELTMVRAEELGSESFVSILDIQEQAFCKKVMDIVPDDALVINIPHDGSAFLYGLYGMNLYYHRGGMGDSESKDSYLLRTELDSYATNSSVQEAVRRTGAQYVLVLDDFDIDGVTHGVFHDYESVNWDGIESIDGNTPGFETVLREGDMCLYKILGIND